VSDAEAEAPTLWPPDVKSQLVGKSLMLAKIEGKRRRGKQRMRRLDDITDSMDIDSTPGFCPVQGRGAWHHAGQGSLASCSTGEPGILQSMGSQRVVLKLGTKQ